jgi:L-amino acid N-acyltransferase YncA
MLTYIEIAEEHLPAVMETYNHYVTHTTITFGTEPLDLDETRTMVIHKNPRFKSYAIMDENGEYAGYALIGTHKARQAYDRTGEVTIYLNPDRVGQGIGKPTLDFMEETAKKNDFHALIAVICTENERSMKLFEKCGYWQAAHYREVGYKFDRFLDIACYQKII